MIQFLLAPMNDKMDEQNAEALVKIKEFQHSGREKRTLLGKDFDRLAELKEEKDQKKTPNKK